MILGYYEVRKRLQNDLVIRPLNGDQIRENGVDLSMSNSFTLMPKTFALAKTKEWIEFPVDLVGLCNLRSTYARRGLFIPPTVVDAGFKGKLVIEIVNFSENPYEFKEGERFLHLIIVECRGAKPYAGRYQYQT